MTDRAMVTIPMSREERKTLQRLLDIARQRFPDKTLTLASFCRDIILKFDERFGVLFNKVIDQGRELEAAKSVIEQAEQVITDLLESALEVEVKAAGRDPFRLNSMEWSQARLFLLLRLEHSAKLRDRQHMARHYRGIFEDAMKILEDQNQLGGLDIADTERRAKAEAEALGHGRLAIIQ